MNFAEHEAGQLLPECEHVTIISGRRITVVGLNYDAVLVAALDIKNAQPIDECPELSAITRDSTSGRWQVDVLTHSRSSE